MLKNAEKIIVAADGDYKSTIKLAQSLKGTGVIIKVNSILRHYGYGLIDELHDLGVRVFADLKLNDIPNTMENDAKNLNTYNPYFLTVMASAGEEGIRRVVDALLQTNVIAVTVLTSLDEVNCRAVYGNNPKNAAFQLSAIAARAGVSGIVLSGQELDFLKHFQGSLVVPGIRPEYLSVSSDDQSRVMTPKQAFDLGATHLVIGRPITEAADPLEALHKILEEIA